MLKERLGLRFRSLVQHRQLCREGEKQRQGRGRLHLPGQRLQPRRSVVNRAPAFFPMGLFSQVTVSEAVSVLTGIP
jgi:hypothetical protein